MATAIEEALGSERIREVGASSPLEFLFAYQEAARATEDRFRVSAAAMEGFDRRSGASTVGWIRGVVGEPEVGFTQKI